jgi:hypothetical protein
MRSVAEWLFALGVLGGAVWMGRPVVQRLAPPLPSAVTLVESDLPGLPSGVPSNAQSVPFVMLLDGGVIRLGMVESDLKSRVRLTAGPPRAEKGVLGERSIQPYRSAKTRFWVVLDRMAVDREREVTAIYVR